MKISTQEQKTDKYAVVGGIGVFSVALLAALSAAYIYSPIIDTNAAESREVDVNLTVSSALSLSTNTNNLALSAGLDEFVYGSINANVMTNSQYGYTLALEDSDNSSNMTHENTSILDAISSSFSGAKTSATMADNTWGFSLDETDFYMIPTLGNPVALKRTNSPMTADYETTKVDFGVKVGPTLTAGTYTDTVKFTAYVNGVDGNPADGTEPLNPGVPPETRTISDITTMQEVSHKICANSVIGAVANLTDTRDNNVYSVEKLNDGNCWMTSDLRLIDYTLTSADSDVPAGYSFTLPASDMNSFNAVGDDSVDSGNRFRVVAAYYDETYGGYYNYYTAVAGWHGDEASVNVNSPQSLCPKGWRLPTGTYGGEYETLNYSAYNYSDTATIAALKLQLRGQTHYSGELDGVGVYGSWWSASVYPGYTFAQYASVYIDDINPAGYASPSISAGIRCIVR